MGAIVYTHPDLLKEISIDSETLDGLNSFFRVHVQTSLYILEIVKQLCENIHFDFVIYDIFGAGELVKEYLQIPGIVSSPIFLIPTEFWRLYLFILMQQYHSDLMKFLNSCYIKWIVNLE